MKIIGITACREGLVYTYIAKEALCKAAYELDVEIHIEQHTALGTYFELTPSEIKDADGVIIASDIDINDQRFDGKRVIYTSTQAAIKDAKNLINQLK